MAGVVGSPYPITVELDAPLDVARWRPFFGWAPVIPHWIIVSIAGAVLPYVAFAGWVVALFAGRLPVGLAGLFAWYHRYTWRVLSYSMGLRESYPPFDFTFTVAEPGDDDEVTWAAPLPDWQSRVGIFFRWLLVIPSAVVLGFIGIGAFFAWIAGAVAVLFTGQWPAGIRDFLVSTARWSGRLNGYAYLLTDRYPPFSLD